MGHIGEDPREIILIPLPEPEEAPVKEPSPKVQPVRQPEKVPA